MTSMATDEPSPIGDVLQGFDGANDLAGRVADRSSREEQPAPVLAEGGEEILDFVAILDQRCPPEFVPVILLEGRFGYPVNDQIREDRPRRGVKGAPLI